MARTQTPLDRARQRMLEADERKDTGTDNEAWDAWQRAATDYWVLLHPELARLRRGDPARVPTIAEMNERAEAITRAMDGVPETWRIDTSIAPTRHAEYLARAGWFHEQVAGLYGPVEGAIARVRRGDASGVETLVRYLEADVYCFGSGYVKADAVRSLARVDLDDATAARARRVVLEVVKGYDRREFRAYIRLALRVDCEIFREELHTLATSPNGRTARHARWVLTGMGERLVDDPAGDGFTGLGLRVGAKRTVD